MQAIKNSMIYQLYLRLTLFFRGQWENSGFVRWLTGKRTPAGGKLSQAGAWLRGRLLALFHALHLDRLLQGSVFLHPAVFAFGAVLLAPLCPTMVSLGLVCASFFSLVVRLGAQREFTVERSPISGYVLLYGGVYLYATVTSTDVAGSLFPGLLTVLFVVFALVIAACAPTEKQLRWLLFGMVLVGVAISGYGFYQKMNPAYFRSVWTDEDMFSAISFRVYSTLENPNVLGEYFLLLIPVGAAMALTAKGWKRAPYLAACALMGVCLILTYSRGCYLGLLFAAAVFLVLLDRRFLVLGIIAVVLSPLYLPESVLERFTSIGNLGDTSTSYRVSIWMGTLAMLKHYWFCGIGPGSGAFNKVYPEYAYNAITAPHSHNLFLQITCDTGVCGLLVFLLLLVAYYRMMFTALAGRPRREIKILQIANVSAVTGFLVQSMTDYTFYNYRVLLLFWATLGLGVVLSRMGKDTPAPEASPQEVQP